MLTMALIAGYIAFIFSRLLWFNWFAIGLFFLLPPAIIYGLIVGFFLSKSYLYKSRLSIIISIFLLIAPTTGYLYWLSHKSCTKKFYSNFFNSFNNNSKPASPESAASWCFSEKEIKNYYRKKALSSAQQKSFERLENYREYLNSNDKLNEECISLSNQARHLNVEQLQILIESGVAPDCNWYGDSVHDRKVYADTLIKMSNLIRDKKYDKNKYRKLLIVFKLLYAEENAAKHDIKRVINHLKKACKRGQQEACDYNPRI